MTARLRVAVPVELSGVDPMTGRGRMWHEVLLRLATDCDLDYRGAKHFRRHMRFSKKPPGVWLFDGHHGPLPVREPQVIQLHEAPWSETETMSTLEPEFLDLVVEPSRRAAKAASAIICPSASSKQQIVEDCDVAPETVFVAHHGVDHGVFRPGVTGGSDVAARFGADKDVPYILTVASLHPRKNLLALRQAFLRLAGEQFPQQLVIVGGPSYGRSDGDDQLASLVAESPEAPGRLVQVPYGISDEELAALMCGAAVFCLPSFSEGFGLPAAEAMACGAPTVLSNRGALKEIGEGAAILVEPDPIAIADGLRSLLVDPVAAATVGFAGAARAELFSWDLCAHTWLRALEFGAAAGARAT